MELVRNILVRAAIATPFALAAAEVGAHASSYWTPWVSEESGYYASCGDLGVRGFACQGRYCDNISLLCDSFPYSALAPSWNGYVTPYFSEEHDNYSTYYSYGWYPVDNENYEVCFNVNYPGGVVSSVGCSGQYCDNISLECRRPVAQVPPYSMLTPTNCWWSGWISEEQFYIDYGPGYFITGIECSGSYCDNKRFHYCSMSL